MYGLRRAANALVLLLCCGSAYAAGTSGTLEWARRVELSTPVSGVVSSVSVEPGDRVAKGAALVTLDQRGFRAELQRARAERTRLKQALAEARRERDRAQELYDRTLLSQHDLDLAKIGHTTAQASYEAAEAALTQAKLALEYSTVRAPFAGVVLSRPAQVGQTVVSRLRSVPLVVLAASGHVLARTAVEEAAVQRLSVGDRATVRLGEREFEGHIERLGLEPLEPRTEPLHYAVDVAFDYPHVEQLRAGQTVTVVLP